jgi:hypothetical protein
MVMITSQPSEPRIFGLREWLAWLDRLATSLFGMTGDEFESAWHEGKLVESKIASDLASMLPLIDRLRRRASGEIPPRPDI